jgi:hypothetical protein
MGISIGPAGGQGPRRGVRASKRLVFGAARSARCVADAEQPTQMLSCERGANAGRGARVGFASVAAGARPQGGPAAVLFMVNLRVVKSSDMQ